MTAARTPRPQLSPVISKAYKLVEHGLTPVPLNGKVPVVTGWQEMQVTPKTVDEWVRDGLLQNVGLRTGDNGVVVLDFDGMAAYEAFVAQFGGQDGLADTYTVATGSGDGMHVYFEVEGGDDNLPASTGQKPVPGGKVEIKAKGRQVVIPPSIHPDTGALYEVFNRTPAQKVATLDDVVAWIESHGPKKELPPKYEPKRQEDIERPVEPGSKQAYARSALAAMASQLAGKTTDRNTTCNRMAWKLAHYVAKGDLTESDVRAALESAMTANGYIASDGRQAFEKTFRSGFEDGLSDTDYLPKVYEQQRKDANSQSFRRELPGKPAYEPPSIVKIAEGVTQIGRTRIVRRYHLFDDLTKRIYDDDYVPDVPPVIFPLQCLHKLGGQARVTKAGKIIGFVGASGSGKTSALETIADAYLDADVPVWMWTPEWTPDEMAERAMQRYGGPTQDELYLHDIDKWRVKALGQSSNPAHRLTTAQQVVASSAIKQARDKQADISFIENTLMTVAEMAEVMAAARAMLKHDDKNPFPRVLIADYAQLLKANEVDEKDDTSMYNMVQRFKALCVYYGLIGIMATQTTKEEARANVKRGAFKGTTVLNCTKNSRGEKGKVRVQSDPARLRLIDTPYPNQQFSSDDHYLGSQAGRYMNDDAFNLWVTLNPEYFEEL